MDLELIVNDRIRAKTVRLVDEDGGVVPLNEALNRARTRNLDLVVIVAGDIPVCRILNADHYRYERKKAAKDQARKQRELTVETKEIQLRPVTDDNDISIKARRARSFLDDGDKVKVVVRFRGRERSHKEHGRDIMTRFLVSLGEHKVEKHLSDDGNNLNLVVAPIVSKAELKRQQPVAAS